MMMMMMSCGGCGIDRSGSCQRGCSSQRSRFGGCASAAVEIIVVVGHYGRSGKGAEGIGTLVRIQGQGRNSYWSLLEVSCGWRWRWFQVGRWKGCRRRCGVGIGQGFCLLFMTVRVLLRRIGCCGVESRQRSRRLSTLCDILQIQRSIRFIPAVFLLLLGLAVVVDATGQRRCCCCMVIRRLLWI